MFNSPMTKVCLILLFRKAFISHCILGVDRLRNNRNYLYFKILFFSKFFQFFVGDPGMGLELGLDLLLFGGNRLNSTARHLLTVAYELLNRQAFAKITSAHLNRRNERVDFFKAE